MDLLEMRNELDKINEELMNLYQKRLDVVYEIGKYKKEHNMQILDTNRENEIIKKMTEKVKDDAKAIYVESFFHFIMEESKKYQK